MKTLKSYSNKEIEVNASELSVLNSITLGDWFDDMPMVNLEEIVDETGLTVNQVKGYISVLDKKNLIKILNGKEYSLGCDCYQLVGGIEEQL